MFNLLSNNAPAVRLLGSKVFLRPSDRTDEKQWIIIREESREFLEYWEPTWPADATTSAAFRRRLKKFSADWRDGLTYAFLIFRREDEVLVGGITLSNVRRGVSLSASMGYWMGKMHARNGYMAEAIQLSLDFSFDTLGLHRIEAACLPSNTPSRNLLLKSGFVQEGFARSYLRINGTWQDHVCYAILRTDSRPGIAG
ncbi:MAG: 30S ribosomal protein S5 alanine N-acetyltransferase [Rhodospirillaceae bacterium]|nr:30S ribosomal protein S5 alanine N-acetyltransferase [Rhodospirillaceae bacterium]